MKRTLMLTGDINLMNVTDPQVPFARVKDTLRQADVLFGNLECCFYEPATGHPVELEGFYAPLASAQALVIGGDHAGGHAHNEKYGGGGGWSSPPKNHAHRIPSTRAGGDRGGARAPPHLPPHGPRFRSVP